MIVILRNGNIYTDPLNHDSLDDNEKFILQKFSYLFKKKYSPYHYSQIFCDSSKNSIASSDIFTSFFPVNHFTICDSLCKPNESESIFQTYEQVSRCLDVLNIRSDNTDLLTIFHVDAIISQILRGIYMRVSPSIFLNFSHDPAVFYTILNHNCREVKFFDNRTF